MKILITSLFLVLSFVTYGQVQVSTEDLKVVVGDINTLSSNFERKIATKTYFNRIAELYGLTYAYLSEKRNNEALKTFQLILKENINHPMLIELEARVLISNNNFNAAQKLCYRGL